MAEHVIGTVADFPVGSSTVVKIRNVEIGIVVEQPVDNMRRFTGGRRQ